VLLALVAAPVGAQSLAEASEAAKKIKHEWPASANAVPVFDPTKVTVVPATSDVVATTSDAPETKETMKAVKKDELYWRTRMRTVTTKLADDQAGLTAAVTVERALNAQAHRNADDILFIRDRVKLAVVENQWQDSVKDVSRLKALVANDTRAKADLDLEAHRAGVPPGWLILE
jgi:hypothetical protein